MKYIFSLSLRLKIYLGCKRLKSKPFLAKPPSKSGGAQAKSMPNEGASGKTSLKEALAHMWRTSKLRGASPFKKGATILEGAATNLEGRHF